MKFPTWLNNWLKPVREFDEDEGGIEAVQVLLILAIAAVILLIFFNVLWPKMRTWIFQQTDDVIKIKAE